MKWFKRNKQMDITEQLIRQNDKLLAMVRHDVITQNASVTHHEAHRATETSLVDNYATKV